MFGRLLLIVAVCVGFALGRADSSQGEALSPLEYERQVKVAFIYNFSRFVEWPDDTFANGTSSFTVCVLGNNPLSGALDTIKGKAVKDKKIAIKRLTNASNMDGCQVLFISSEEKEHLTQILESARKLRVLTIGEMSQFNRAGGIVALAMRKNRIRFSVNLEAAEETGMKISSRVLSLATVVNYDHQGDGR